MTNLNDMKQHAKDKTNDFYKQGIAKAFDAFNVKNNESIARHFTESLSSIYEEGKQKVNDLEDSVGEYSDKLIKSVKDKPITSILIAGSIVFLVSQLFKK